MVVFSVCALVCIGVLALRRKYFGAELGSKMRWPTAILFVSLWLIYVILSTLVAYEEIPTF